jgi:protein TonB
MFMKQEVIVVNKTTRVVSSIAGSLFISVTLFFIMSTLISGGKNMKRSDDKENFIDFVRMKRVSNTEVKKRELPKKPEIKQNETPKEMFKTAAQDVKPERPNNMKFDTPKLDIPLAVGAGGNPVAGGGGGAGSGSSDSEEIPLVRVEPQFPAEAALKGILKGWVRLVFDLNTDGSVTNVQVAGSNPREVFDMAARKAVLKWRYRPKIIDWYPFMRKGLKVLLDFGDE